MKITTNKFKIIIAPSKKMNFNAPYSVENTLRPKHLMIAKEIFGTIKTLSEEETKEIFKLSDKKAHEVFEMHKTHGQKLYYAFDLYDGLFYKQLDILTNKQKAWVNEHVLILDALYGFIKPYEKIGDYRLDYTIKLPGINQKEIWSGLITKELEGYDVYNLASKEFSSLVKLPLIEVPLSREGNIKIARGKKLMQMIIENS